jgi:nucleoside-diphosphate-sugar epimerase
LILPLPEGNGVKNSISIIGLGHVGKPLARALKLEGHRVLGTTRLSEKAQVLEAEGIKVGLLSYPNVPASGLLETDIIVLNIPPFPGELEWFRSWSWKTYSWVIFLSSTSVYQDSPVVVSENSPLKETDLLSQEKWVQERFQSWTILRLGGLLGGERHPGKSMVGKKNLKGPRHAVNLIHHDDVVGFIQTVIKKHLTNDIFNVVCDEHSPRQEFYSAYATFDESDRSMGKVVSNEKMKQHYELKHPRVF